MNLMFKYSAKLSW